MYMWACFWSLYFVPLICCSVLKAVSQPRLLSLKLWSGNMSSNFVHFQSCFEYSKYFAFPYEFWSQFINFIKKAAGILIRIVLTVDQFGQN